MTKHFSSRSYIILGIGRYITLCARVQHQRNAFGLKICVSACDRTVNGWRLCRGGRRRWWHQYQLDLWVCPVQCSCSSIITIPKPNDSIFVFSQKKKIKYSIRPGWSWHTSNHCTYQFKQLWWHPAVHTFWHRCATANWQCSALQPASSNRTKTRIPLLMCKKHLLRIHMVPNDSTSTEYMCQKQSTHWFWVIAKNEKTKKKNKPQNQVEKIFKKRVTTCKSSHLIRRALQYYIAELYRVQSGYHATSFRNAIISVLFVRFSLLLLTARRNWYIDRSNDFKCMQWRLPQHNYHSSNNTDYVVD